MDKNTFEKKYNTVGVNIFRTHQFFCQDVLKLHPGEIGVVSNGKVSRRSSCSLFLMTVMQTFFCHKICVWHTKAGACVTNTQVRAQHKQNGYTNSTCSFIPPSIQNILPFMDAGKENVLYLSSSSFILTDVWDKT
jgi:hypothetical protein